MGQIIDSMPLHPGGRPGKETTEVDLSSFSPRQKAVEDAGLSEHEATTALRLARVPEDQYDENLTVGELAGLLGRLDFLLERATARGV